MAIEQISCAPEHGINEDLVAVFDSEGLTDLLVLDGASSVADTDYLPAHGGDVAWFVQAFAAALGPVIDADRTQAESVQLAIDAVRQSYLAQTAGQDVPMYAWPLAALSWIRIRHGGEGGQAMSLSLYCLGDCKAFAVDADGLVIDLDPYVNPFESVVQEAVAALAREGVTDPDQRRARLLPFLRARREAQHASTAPASLCLAPQGPFAAREYGMPLPAGASIVAMTDGFHRLADTYGLYTQEDLVRRCRAEGIAGLMRELRAFETARAGNALAVKNADDASAIMWTPDGVDLIRSSIHASIHASSPGLASGRPTEEPA